MESNITISSTGCSSEDVNILVDGKRLNGVRSLSIDKINHGNLLSGLMEVYVKNSWRDRVPWNLVAKKNPNGTQGCSFFVEGKLLKGIASFSFEKLSPSVEDEIATICFYIKQLGK